MKCRERRIRRTRERYEAIVVRISQGLDPRKVHLIRRGSKTTVREFLELEVPVAKGLAIRKLQNEIRTCCVYNVFMSD